MENRMRFALSVVAEVKRVIAAHANRPFALGYRISAEEPGANGYGITDSLALLDHLIAAGGLRTPQQAEQALALGLSVVVVGKGLVMNPDWVELAQSGRADEIETALDPAQISALAIPENSGR